MISLSAASAIASFAGAFGAVYMFFARRLDDVIHSAVASAIQGYSDEAPHAEDASRVASLSRAIDDIRQTLEDLRSDLEELEEDIQSEVKTRQEVVKGALETQAKQFEVVKDLHLKLETLNKDFRNAGFDYFSTNDSTKLDSKSNEDSTLEKSKKCDRNDQEPVDFRSKISRNDLRAFPEESASLQVDIQKQAEKTQRRRNRS